MYIHVHVVVYPGGGGGGGGRGQTVPAHKDTYMYIILFPYQLIWAADLHKNSIDNVAVLVALHDGQKCLDGTALKLHGFILMVLQGSQLHQQDDLNYYVYATGLI